MEGPGDIRQEQGKSLNNLQKGMNPTGRSVWWRVVFALLLLGVVQVAGAEDENSSYRMGPGDKVKILVFGETDLSLETHVGESGLVSYPFLGELVVSGKTPLEFEREIATRLRDGYLVNPEVTVTVLEYRKFYVDGHVNSPGGFQFQPGMTVRKAISLAGGFGPRADRGKIYVVQGEQNADGSIKNSTRIGIDDSVRPGDVITVDRSFF